jgi:hypothetical protein
MIDFWRHSENQSARRAMTARPEFDGFREEIDVFGAGSQGGAAQVPIWSNVTPVAAHSRATARLGGFAGTDHGCALSPSIGQRQEVAGSNSIVLFQKANCTELLRLFKSIRVSNEIMLPFRQNG